MIPVDEADAFDRLSILEVKMERYAPNEKRFTEVNAFDDAAKAIQKSVPNIKLVWESDEYKALKSANEKTFKLVEKAKLNECSAQDVDRANHSRYLAKKALQEKFFPKSPLTEIKTERPY